MPRASMIVGVLVSLSAAGCMSDTTGSGWDPGGGGVDPGGPIIGASCTVATDCASGQVCARDHECLDPSQARSVLVHWTIGGAAADGTSCAGLTKMEITYSATSDGDLTGFSPLMCTAGQFFVDVWPARFDQTGVDATTPTGVIHGAATLPTSGDAEVTVDLVP